MTNPTQRFFMVKVTGCAVEPIKGKIDYAPNIEATIEELLK